jgi:hypothetical protein
MWEGQADKLINACNQASALYSTCLIVIATVPVMLASMACITFF